MRPHTWRSAKDIAVAFEGAEAMSVGELEGADCNRSAVHIDIPFGSPEVRIEVTESREGKVVLTSQGLWVERLAGS